MALVILGRQTYMVHTAEPLMPETSLFAVEMATEKLTGNKSPDVDHIRAELIKAGDRTIRSEIHKHINSIWNKELPEERKESDNVPIYKKRYKTDCSNYTGKRLLSATYKILSNILPSWLTLYAKEITGDHQCGF